MRGLGVCLACLVFLAGCHERADRSPEPGDAAIAEPDFPEGDASSGLGTDASSQPPPIEPPAPPTDAGVSLDARVDPMDATVDPVDASRPLADAGSAPEIDAGAVDAGPDPVDAGADASTDAGVDPVDSSVPDAGVEPVDAGPPDSGVEPEDAGNDSGVDASVPPCHGPPGLYQDADCQVLSDGIRAFQPQFPLWSDGALKQRFVSLPAGKKIDTTNPDRWTFPTGTRFYKTFSTSSLRVETRIIEKIGSSTGIDSWTLTSYAWSADQRSVSPASSTGVTNALGTQLDIPSQAQCRQCHNMTGVDAPIGFNAIQLNHEFDGVTLGTLLDEAVLVNGSASAPRNVSRTNATIPGDATARAALGYLHGNCGHCHGGPSPRAELRLWLTVGMTDLSDAPILGSAVCQCLERWTGRENAAGVPYELRVAPSHAAVSGLIGRMRVRGAGEQMPPVGTKLVDAAGIATIQAWIDSLDGGSCEVSAPVCTP